ncbi:MAG TPA: HAD-IIB family hydrolase [Nitrospira sp.]|nr:HAD-IIB family hydrolase [Nitrospira sp.]
MQQAVSTRTVGARFGELLMRHYVVFSDLDDTLLDAGGSFWETAKPALEALRAHGIPLILVSSRTRAEIEPLRRRLQHRDPFIVENGAAVFVPQGLFTFPLERGRTKSPYEVIELGMPYHMLRDVLKQIEDAVETPLPGFGDLPIEEIMQITGLCHADATLAKMREYDEPFLLNGSQAVVEEVCRQIETRGLRWRKSGGLFHLSGDNDKGEAAELLMRCYQREQRIRFQARRVESVGIGGSINDVPLLANVDHPILVQKPDGSFDREVLLPRLVRTRGMGAAGWNGAVLRLLRQSASERIGGMGLAG